MRIVRKRETRNHTLTDILTLLTLLIFLYILYILIEPIDSRAGARVI